MIFKVWAFRPIGMYKIIHADNGRNAIDRAKSLGIPHPVVQRKEKQNGKS